MSKTDIHLVSWNRPKMTELVIKTIHRNTKRENFRLVVLDNGSEGDTPELLQQMADNGLIDEFIPLKTNLGLESARNLLLKNATRSDYFVCVDNDCLPPPVKDGQDWMERLLELMHKYEGYSAISMRTDPMIGTGNIFEEADKVGDDIVDFPHPGGSFRIMNTKDVIQAGGWDRGAEGRGAEEKYICGKLRELGFQTAFAVQILCLHLFGTRGDNPTDRWGYDKKMTPEESGHSDIWHPKFAQGDDYDEIIKYAGKEHADLYFKK